jgi:hypothetical protein
VTTTWVLFPAEAGVRDFTTKSRSIMEPTWEPETANGHEPEPVDPNPVLTTYFLISISVSF